MKLQIIMLKKILIKHTQPLTFVNGCVNIKKNHRMIKEDFSHRLERNYGRKK